MESTLAPPAVVVVHRLIEQLKRLRSDPRWAYWVSDAAVYAARGPLAQASVPLHVGARLVPRYGDRDRQDRLNEERVEQARAHGTRIHARSVHTWPFDEVLVRLRRPGAEVRHLKHVEAELAMREHLWLVRRGQFTATADHILLTGTLP